MVNELRIHTSSVVYERLPSRNETLVRWMRSCPPAPDLSQGERENMKGARPGPQTRISDRNILINLAATLAIFRGSLLLCTWQT